MHLRLCCGICESRTMCVKLVQICSRVSHEHNQKNLPNYQTKLTWAELCIPIHLSEYYLYSVTLLFHSSFTSQAKAARENSLRHFPLIQGLKCPWAKHLTQLYSMCSVTERILEKMKDLSFLYLAFPVAKISRVWFYWAAPRNECALL